MIPVILRLPWQVPRNTRCNVVTRATIRARARDTKSLLKYEPHTLREEREDRAEFKASVQPKVLMESLGQILRNQDQLILGGKLRDASLGEVLASGLVDVFGNPLPSSFATRFV